MLLLLLLLLLRVVYKICQRHTFSMSDVASCLQQTLNLVICEAIVVSHHDYWSSMTVVRQTTVS